MNKKGFTLIELLAVIVVLAIVSVIATTLVVRYMSNAKMDTFAVEASNVIASAKNAVSMNELNKLEIENNDNSCKIGNRMCFTIDTLIELGIFKGNKEVYDGKVNIDISDKQNLKYKLFLEKKDEFNIVDSNVIDYSKNKDTINKGNFSGEEIEEYTICSCVEDKTKPVIEKFYIENESQEYLTKKDTKLYISWLDEDVKYYCVTDVNNSNSCNWIETNENDIAIDYTFNNDEEKKLYAFIKDKNRNISESVEAKIIVDTISPLDNSIIINDGDMFTNNVSVTLTLSSSGANEMCISNTDTCNNWEPYKTNKEWELNNNTNERKIVYVWFKDNVGNTSEVVEDTILLDNEAPTGNSIKINEDNEYTTERAVTLTLVSDGATEMCVSNTNECETWEDYVTSKVWTLTEGEGEKTVYVWYRDLSSNESECVSDTVIYDSNPPTLTVTTPTGTSSSSPTYVKASAYTVSGTASDTYGIDSVTVNGTAVTVAADGTWSKSLTLTEGVVTTVKVIATDKAGKSTTVTRYVSYDISAPKNSSIRINNSEYTNSTSVTLYLSSTGAKQMCVSNTTSCSSWITYATSKSWTLTSGDGTKRVYAWFRDGAGNTTSSYVSDTINLDTVSPTVSGSAVNNNTSTPKISFSSNEAGEYCINTSSTKSNMNSCVASGSISASSTLQTSALTTSNTYYVHVKDNAGNYGISSAISITRTNPTISETLLASPPSGLNTTLQGGMYRFQGAHGSVNNYICFGTTNKSTCIGNTDRYMYRIIGINSSGQVKLIQSNVIYTNTGWKYLDASNITWSNSDLYTGLNGSSFLTNTTYVPSGWGDRIETVEWKYGDLKAGYPDGSSLTASYLYSKENSFSNKISAKIGLLYMHDYAYAYQSGGLNCSSVGEYSTCKNSWIHLSNSAPNTTFDKEWTITRYGTIDVSLQYYSWTIDKNGLYQVNIIRGPGAWRAVFYLKANVEYVSGSGTASDPFIIS